MDFVVGRNRSWWCLGENRIKATTPMKNIVIQEDIQWKTRKEMK